MRILVLDSDSSARATVVSRIEEALRQAGVRRVELIESTPAGLASLVAEAPPNICFLGPGCYRDLEQSLHHCRVSYPRVPVALILSNEIYSAEAVELRRSLKIRIIPIADIGQMAQFVLDCDAPSAGPATGSKGTIISVLQFKGGVGATTLTAGLGACWARHGVSAVMVDFDDVNPQLTDWARVGASQRRLISEGVRAAEVPKYRIRELIYPVEDFSEKLFVVGQPEHYGEGFHFKADVLENTPSIVNYVSSLLDALQSEYDVVIIDCGRSWGLSTFAALTASQRVLTVIDDDAASLRRTFDNFGRIHRESDDPSEFDLGKWSFVLNAHTGRVLTVEEVTEEIGDADVFPGKPELMTIPFSDKGREWSLTSQSFYDLAEPYVKAALAEQAFRLFPFQHEVQSPQLIDRLRKMVGV